MIRDIIRKYDDRDSLYGDKLTNHLNMGLYALHKMGASDERLHEFASAYISHSNLPPLPSAKEIIDDNNFERYLGIDGYYSSYIPFFENQLEYGQKEAVIKKYLDILIRGEAGGAFHGLIRLAYAVELDDDYELARALAYFAEAYCPFPVAPEVEKMLETADPVESIGILAENSYFINFKFKRGLIIGRMNDIYDDPRFFEVIKSIPDHYCDSRRYSDLLIRLYLMTEDFTVLHGLTSTHALRVLETFFGDYQTVLKHHWHLLQLAYLSTNCATITEIPSDYELREWPEIFKKACLSHDVHTLKLVYSLSEQSRISRSDSLYRLAAWKKITK